MECEKNNSDFDMLKGKIEILAYYDKKIVNILTYMYYEKKKNSDCDML